MKKIITAFQNVINTSPTPPPPPGTTINDDMNAKYRHIVHTKELFASRNRYVTYIATDKPIYRPGDTVYFRSWPLHAHTFEPLLRPAAQKLFPPANGHQQRRGARWEIISPSDAVVMRMTEVGIPDWGTISDSWTIPEGLAGGNYKLRVIYDIEGFPAAEREFNIREFSNPRFKMQLEFVRKGLGPGDEATANLNAVKADGSFLKNAKVEAVARVDGTEVHRSSHTLDEKGNLQVKFTLPREIARGEGTLSCAIDDGASVENVSKTIPIIMQTIDVRAYAEGGELVAGLKCGLYIESFLINGDPADLTAEIIDDRNITVGNIQTQHEGRGRSAFVPEAGRQYKLRVLQPSGIKSPTALPGVLNEGVTVSSLQNTWSADENVRVRVAATKPAVYKVSIFKKDVVVSTSYADIDRPCGEKEIAFTLPASSLADGVLRITVFGPDGNPVAERLTFRKPAGKMNIVVQSNKKRYSPGEKVTLKIRAYDAQTSEPIGALLGVSVTDDTVLEMVEKRKQAPRLPVQAYFESEVDHLDDAHIYLDAANPMADAAVDLLLGTQGWRRFAYVDTVKYMELAEVKKPVPPIDLSYRRAAAKLSISNAANSSDVTVTSDADGDQLFQTTKELPRNTPIQYYEVTIEALAAKDPVVAVGFAHNRYALTNKLPGWENESVAVHSDDGCFFKDGAQVQRNWLFGAKDTVGIGYNEITKQVFFTKNGELKGLAGSIKNSDVLQYFLTIGIRGKGTSVRVNGNGPFKLNPASVFSITKPKNTEAAERLLAVHHFDPNTVINVPFNTLEPMPSPPSPRSDLSDESEEELEGGAPDEDMAEATLSAPVDEMRVESIRPMAVQSASPMRRMEAADRSERSKKESASKDKLSSPIAGKGLAGPLRSGAPMSKAAPLASVAKGAPSPRRDAAPPPPPASMSPAPPPAAGPPPPRSSSVSQGLARSSSSKKSVPMPSPSISASARLSSRSEIEEEEAPMRGEAAEKRSRRLPSRIPTTLARPHPVLQPLPLRTIVREYAHVYKPASNPLERVDFKETLYWNASIMTNPFSDHVITFDLSDSITSFKVIVDGVSRVGGMISTTSEVLPSTEPFYIEFKLPIEVSCGDKLQIPVSVNNDTNNELKVQFKAASSTPALSLVSLKQSKKKEKETKDPKELKRLLFDGHKNIAVSAHGNKRVLVHAAILQAFVNASLTLNAFSDSHRDLITRGMRIVPAGFPFRLSASGGLKMNTDRTHSFSIPLKTEPSSIASSIKFYLNPLGNMTQALRALVREPYGCFEQTSSVAYPLVMAQQYFLTHRGVDPQLIEEAKKNLQKSYDRLKGFEVKTAGVIPSGGFDWYGSAPANESLTAYGLLEFQDMKEVYPVEDALIARIKAWLVSRRDGRGQFLRGSGRYGFGHAPQDVTNAYICWALSERGGAGADLSKELSYILPLCDAAKSSDPYYVGLCTLVMYNSGRVEDGNRLANKLVAMQDKTSGVVTGGVNPKMHDSRFTSITYSYGDGLLIEATSFAVLAWLRGGEEYMVPLENAMKWLSTRCKDGAFGSTQSTILALKAIVEYDKMRSNSLPGAITLLLDGKQIAEIEVNAKSPAVMDGPDIAPFLRESGGGAHELKVKLEGGGALTYSIAIGYNALQPDDDPGCPIRLTTQLVTPQINEGEGGEIKVTLTNTDATTGQPMVVGLIGLPGGVEPRHEQLREHVKSGKIDFYEVLGREVVLYLREMGPSQKLELPIDVVAKVPGVYQGPASRAYLYYTNESKHWAAPLQVTILPKAN